MDIYIEESLENDDETLSSFWVWVLGFSPKNSLLFFVALNKSWKELTISWKTNAYYANKSLKTT